MRLLFDQNLSRKLVSQLNDEFPHSVHLTDFGLETAVDREIWEYARRNDFTIVSKDSDFRQLAFTYGPPPKIIWLRIGNSNTDYVLETLIRHRKRIEVFCSAEDESFLVLPDIPNW